MKTNAMKGLFGLTALCLMGAANIAHADVVLWIDDTSNNIGTVNLTTGAVNKIGNAGTSSVLTDIGFTSSGALYGVTFDHTYKINTTTGVAGSSLANNPSNGINALVGSTGGLLFGASNDTQKIYTFNTTTNAWTTLTGSTFDNDPSAGDLSFSGTTLYESAQDDNGRDELLKITLTSGGNIASSTFVGDFSLGSTHFDDVFGLASDGINTYAVDGTKVYKVNLANADLTFVMDYSGHGLGDANGTAFFSEAGAQTLGAVPEASTWAMMLLGFGGIGALLRSRRQLAAVATA